MRQGGYFPGKIMRVVDKFSNAWVKFPNEKKEHWWPVTTVLQWIPSSELSMRKASAVSYPHKGVEGEARSDHNVCDTRLFYALAYSPITITDWPAKKNRRSSAKNIP